MDEERPPTAVSRLEESPDRGWAACAACTRAAPFFGNTCVPMSLPPDLRQDLLTLTARVRAQLEVEAELGNTGLRVPAASGHGLGPRSQAAHVPVAQGRMIRSESKAPSPVVAVARQAAAPASVPQRGEGASVAVADGALVGEQAPFGCDAVDAGDRRARLQVLADAAASCTACVLHEKRTRSVFARGSPDAELVFVGEGPGRDEDLQGFPFVGAAGQLLDKMIAAMGYGRDDVYVCNVVKCRPPENRTPRPEEAIACARFLVPQLEIVAPRVIVALGRCAAQALGVAAESGPWRGRWGAWRGIATMPTYHPAFLLRSPEFKRTVWEDLQQVMARLGRTPPRRTS